MFTFNGSQTMVYPDIVVDGAVLVAEPGKAYAVETAPDANWSAGAPQKAPVAPAEPATAPTESTPTN